MLRSALRKTTGTLAVCSLLAMVLLPQEHVHLSRTHDGHHPDVVHRHFEWHAEEAGLVFDHEESRVEWLATPFTQPQVSSSIFPVLQALDDLMPVQPQDTAWPTLFRVVNVSAHDPPWIPSSALRAPPSLS